MGVVVYEIDQHDRLVFVNDEWDTFALLNDGANVTRRSILTHSLWEFISDATTQQIYRKMLARIRMGVELLKSQPPGADLSAREAQLEADIAEHRIYADLLEQDWLNPLMEKPHVPAAGS